MNAPWPSSCQWPVVPLRRHYDVRLGKMLQPQTIAPGDELVPYLKAGLVQWDGVRGSDLPQMWASPGDLLRYEVGLGDLLVCEGGEVGRSTVLREPVPAGTIFQNSVHRVRARDARPVDFLGYVLRALHGAGWFEVVCNKATIPHLTVEKLGAIPVPTPPPDTQREMVRRLDREIARTRALAESQRRLLTLAVEKRTSLLSELLCGGATLGKDLCTDSLPSGWKVVPLKRSVERIIDYRGATPAKTLSGVRLVTAGNIKNGRIDFSDGEEFVGADDYSSWMRRGLPETGDLLLTTEAPLGEVAAVDDPQIALAQRIILLRVDRAMLRSDFLYWQMRSPLFRSHLTARATGSTALGIKAERLREIPVLVPPLDEQAARVQEITAYEKRVRSLAEDTERQLALLAEYEESLISATLIGKAPALEAA